MSITNTTTSISYAGSGTAPTLSFPFMIFESSDLVVTFTNTTTLAVTTYVLGTDYTVTFTAGIEGGSVVFTTVVPTGGTLLITRSVPVTHATQYNEYDPLPAATLESDFDKLTVLAQQINALALLTVTLNPVTTGISTQVTTLQPAALQLLRVNSLGTGLEFVTLSVTNGIAALLNDPSPTLGADLTLNGHKLIGPSVWTGADNWATGANIASATTTSIGTATGNSVSVIGTTTITSLGAGTAGMIRVVTFTGILTLTYNSTSLILPGSANITTAAGDIAVFQSLGSSNWQCVVYTKRAGQSQGNLTGDVTSSGLATTIANNHGYMLLGSYTANNTTLGPIFTGLTGANYSQYLLVFDSLLASTTTQSLILTLSAGSGFVTGTAYEYASNKVGNAIQVTKTAASQAGINIISLDTLINTSAANAISGEIRISNPAGTQTVKTVFYESHALMTSGIYVDTRGSGQGSIGTAAIDGISLVMPANVTSGTAYLYGLRNS